MKKINLSILAIVAVALFFITSCEKDDNNEIKDQSSRLVYYLNGIEKINLEDFNETDSSSYVIIDDKTVLIFNNDTDLSSWTEQVSQNSRVSEIKNSLKEKLNFVNEFYRLAKSKGIAIDNEDELGRFYDEYYNNENSRIAGGLGFMWDNANRTGAFSPIFRTPFLLNFDNKASSIEFIGISTALCEKKYWKGTKKWLFISVDDLHLSTVGFDNVTSSVL